MNGDRVPMAEIRLRGLRKLERLVERMEKAAASMALVSGNYQEGYADGEMSQLHVVNQAKAAQERAERERDALATDFNYEHDAHKDAAESLAKYKRALDILSLRYDSDTLRASELVEKVLAAADKVKP